MCLGYDSSVKDTREAFHLTYPVGVQILGLQLQEMWGALDDLPY